MKSKHIWGPVVSEFAWNLYGNAATLGQNCQFSRLQQTNLLAYMFCLGIKNHHFSATSWCMSNRVSFQNQATDTCCQESRHESLILIGSQNLYFDAFGSLYLSFPKKLRYTIVIYGKIQSYRNCKIQGWSCTKPEQHDNSNKGTYDHNNNIKANMPEKFNWRDLDLFIDNMQTYFQVTNTPMCKHPGVLRLNLTN